jgi:hypothetical protein
MAGLVLPMLSGPHSSTAQAGGAADGVQACLAIAGDSERLRCYDSAARRLAEPRFAGRLSFITERFEILEPTWLRYQSDGAIFVLYLKTNDDEVVQNLHIGGGGEDRYLIEKPGAYFLQINGSEAWRVWLEPQAAPGTN